MTFIVNRLLSMPNMEKMLGFNIDLFDHLDSTLKSVSNLTDNLSVSTYPPDNVVKVEDGEYRIDLALAGWDEDELKISTYEQGKITYVKIEGELNDESDDTSEFVRRGISYRKFTKTYVVPKNTEIKEITFKNGLLSVHLELPKPKPERPEQTFKVGYRKK